MLTNEAIVRKFYTAFQQRDFSTMNSCYSDDIVFSDPVFGLLRGDEVKYMWEMLCTNATDFSLQYDQIIEIDAAYITCEWVAAYTFSQTGNKVVNHIKAFMRCKDGKIIEHSDAFKLRKWAGQALGWKGSLFGWMSWMQRKIQTNARKSLIRFIEKKDLGR